MNTYMTFCRQADGNGTIHITDAKARNAEEAARKGKEECLTDWNWEDSPDDVHCIGVILAPEGTEVKLWDDENDLAALPIPEKAEASVIELDSRKDTLEVFDWEREQKGEAPDGVEVTAEKSGKYTYYTHKFPELFPEVPRHDMSAPFVAEFAGRRWKITVETGEGPDPWPSWGKARFEPTPEPLTEPEEIVRGDYSSWGGQPKFIQGTYLPMGPDGKSAYPLCVIESGWGDAGNENLFVALDEDGLPCGLYFEASCC